MLEKSSKKVLFDAHFHYSLADSSQWIAAGCTCAHSIEEWNKQYELVKELGDSEKNVKLSFGIHPQCIGNSDFNVASLIDFLLQLTDNSESSIAAIGETGFDFFTEDFKKNKEKQEELFIFQAELAAKKNLPLIVHCRKGNEKLFENSKLLCKVPSVLFHSFMGTSIEANSLLKRGINGFFSFGKQMLNGNRKVIECASVLPLEVLLCETDAPFQTLKGQQQTYLREIETVYKTMFELRKDCKEEDAFIISMEKNFYKLFSM